MPKKNVDEAELDTSAEDREIELFITQVYQELRQTVLQAARAVEKGGVEAALPFADKIQKLETLRQSAGTLIVTQEELDEMFGDLDDDEDEDEDEYVPPPTPSRGRRS